MLRLSGICRIAALAAWITLIGAAEGQPGNRTQVAAAPARYRVGIMFRPGAAEGEVAGLEIAGTAPSSAAERAGLKAGDIITQINSRPAGTDPQEFAHVFGAPEAIEMQVQRDGKLLSISVTPEPVVTTRVPLAQRPQESNIDSRDLERVPIRMDYGKPSVLAHVNGKGPWIFFVDSGAGVTVLDRSLVEELRLPTEGKRRIGGPSDPEAIESDVVKVASVTLGGIEFKDVEAVSWDRSQLYPGRDGAGPRGVLGIGLFEEYLLTFDYPSSEIVLERGELPDIDHNEVIPYTLGEYGIPIVEISIADKTMSAHFDTGSPGALSIPAKAESMVRFRSPPKVVGRARTVDKEFEIRSARLDGNAMIGGHVFESPDVMLIDVLDRPNAANIGSALLRDFTLSFDQKNRRVRLRNCFKT